METIYLNSIGTECSYVSHESGDHVVFNFYVDGTFKDAETRAKEGDCKFEENHHIFLRSYLKMHGYKIDYENSTYIENS